MTDHQRELSGRGAGRRGGRRSARAAILGLAAAGLLAGPALAGTAAAAEGPVVPPRTEECIVPPLLFQVAAVVDPDSLEGCGFFEDPNYFDNRREAGLYNPNGVFSILFG